MLFLEPIDLHCMDRNISILQSVIPVRNTIRVSRQSCQFWMSYLYIISAVSPQLTFYLCLLYGREENQPAKNNQQWIPQSAYLWLYNQTDLTDWFRVRSRWREVTGAKLQGKKAWSRCQTKESQESEWYKSPFVPYFTNISTRSGETEGQILQ